MANAEDAAHITPAVGKLIMNAMASDFDEVSRGDTYVMADDEFVSVERRTDAHFARPDDPRNVVQHREVLWLGTPEEVDILLDSVLEADLNADPTYTDDLRDVPDEHLELVRDLLEVATMLKIMEIERRGLVARKNGPDVSVSETTVSRHTHPDLREVDDGRRLLWAAAVETAEDAIVERVL